MTVVDDPVVAEAPRAHVGSGLFGAGFVWFPADDAPGFDPVTHVAIGDTGPVGPEWMAAVVEHCAQGLALLESIDPSSFDAGTTTMLTPWA